jgi:hypothetical protein
MKSLCVGISTNLCKVYKYHDSRNCSYKRSRILPRIEGMGMEWLWLWLWNNFGMVMVVAWYWIEKIFGVAL